MTKAELRTLYKAKRQALSAESVDRASEQICRLWQEYMNKDDIFFAKDVIFIHVFLPIKSQNEVDTWLIIKRIWQDFPTITVVTSLSDIKSNTLTHFELTSGSDLVINRYGISEPNPETSAPVSATSIDLVLIPLLAFDKRGHRVGYGKGFYDRFLANCRPDCLKIGLSVFEPVDNIPNVVDTDVALDVCITPKQVWRFL